MLVVSAAVVAILVMPKEDSQSPKFGAKLPAATPNNARKTLMYLNGRGAALMRMHREAISAPLKGGRQHCEQVVQRLDNTAPSASVAGLLTGVADEPMRTAFNGERLSLGVGLTRCVKNRQATRQDATGLVHATGVVSVRLDELQAATR